MFVQTYTNLYFIQDKKLLVYLNYNSDSRKTIVNAQKQNRTSQEY